MNKIECDFENEKGIEYWNINDNCDDDEQKNDLDESNNSDDIDKNPTYEKILKNFSLNLKKFEVCNFNENYVQMFDNVYTCNLEYDYRCKENIDFWKPNPYWLKKLVLCGGGAKGIVYFGSLLALYESGAIYY